MVKSIVFRFCALVLSLIMAFSIVELATRIFRPQVTGPIKYAFDAELGNIPVPNQRGQRSFPGAYRYAFSNNSSGFRGQKEYGLEKTTHFRVLLLGDSFTYGIGVNDAQTFAYHIERMLAASLGSTEIINTGNGGKGTDYELKLFQTLGYKFKPDLVALCFFSNDYDDNERQEYFSRDDDGKLQAKTLKSSLDDRQLFVMSLPGYNWLMSWSQAANLLKDATFNYMSSGSSARKTNPVTNDYNQTHQYSNDKNIELTYLYLSKLRQAVRSAKSNLIVFYIPNFYEVERYRKNRAYLNDEKTLIDLTARLGINYFSLTPIIADTNYKIDDLYYKEGHWTATAHRLAAEYMSGHIKQSLTNH